MSFQPGDRVSLVTSSLPMVVESITGDDVTCVRQDGRGKTHRETFKLATLKKFTPRGPITFQL